MVRERSRRSARRPLMRKVHEAMMDPASGEGPSFFPNWAEIVLFPVLPRKWRG